MQRRLDRRSILTGLLALGLVMAFATTAVGQTSKSRAQAASEDVVTSVDPAAGTVTLGNETYRIGGSSRLFDAEGRRIKIGELAANSTGQMAEFVLRRGSASGMREIRRLQVREGDFE